MKKLVIIILMVVSFSLGVLIHMNEKIDDIQHITHTCTTVQNTSTPFPDYDGLRVRDESLLLTK